MPLREGETILGGKYRIVRPIGEGGMGRVWLAEELSFGGREVALKEPRSDLLPDDLQEVQRRYQREIQVCAALEKAGVPNLVPVLTTEQQEGRTLLVMRYMAGGDLERLMREHPGGLPVQQAVGIALAMLRALHGAHAHPMEIVHRDVKPSNVLFDDRGRAHLADFGAAQIAGASGDTRLRPGYQPGTPLYMAPEQGASPGYLSPAADLYALGCVLFEMLTGKRYKRFWPGTRASDLRPELPSRLDEALARALAEDPYDRWQEATEMGAALEQGLTAEKEGALRQAEERARREAERRAAEEVASRAREQAEAEAEAQRRRETDERARREAEERARREAEEQRRESAARVIAPATAERPAELAGHGKDTVSQISLSPDGKLLAAASSQGAYVYDADSLTEVRLLATTDPVNSVAFSPDGTTLASGSDDNTVKLWDVAAGREIGSLSGHTYWVRSVAFSRDGKTLASGGDGKSVKLWDVAAGRGIRGLSGHTASVNTIVFPPDGKTLASGSGDGTVRLWGVR